jgi:hypothetical protein
VRALPKDFRRDVQRFYENEWGATGGNDDLAMLRPLPLSLQVRALTALHGHVLEMVPFFNARINDLRFWRILLKGLEQVSYMEGEWLMREGETAEHLFLIKSGQCELISERFEGQGLDEDGRPRNKAPVLPDQGPHSPQWELLDWEEETRRAKDEADGVGASPPAGQLKIQPFDKAAARTHVNTLVSVFFCMVVVCSRKLCCHVSFFSVFAPMLCIIMHKFPLSYALNAFPVTELQRKPFRARNGSVALFKNCACQAEPWCQRHGMEHTGKSCCRTRSWRVTRLCHSRVIRRRCPRRWSGWRRWIDVGARGGARRRALTLCRGRRAS